MQRSPSIKTLTVSQQRAVFLWKSCYLHMAYLLASSIATGATQNQGSSLDCKICGRWLDNGMQVAQDDIAYRASKAISAQKFRLTSKCEAAAFEALKSVTYRSIIDGQECLVPVATDDKVRWGSTNSYTNFAAHLLWTSLKMPILNTHLSSSCQDDHAKQTIASIYNSNASVVWLALTQTVRTVCAVQCCWHHKHYIDCKIETYMLSP